MGKGDPSLVVGGIAKSFTHSGNECGKCPGSYIILWCMFKDICSVVVLASLFTRAR